MYLSCPGSVQNIVMINTTDKAPILFRFTQKMKKHQKKMKSAPGPYMKYKTFKLSGICT